MKNLHIRLKKGPQTLDGAKAEQFMRFRQPNSYTGEITKFYDGSDLKRISAQQEFIKELIKQKVNIKYISKIDDIINIVFKNITTNISPAEAVKFAKNLGKLKVGEINAFTLPGQPLESGGWYYAMDKAAAKEITTRYFISKYIFSEEKKSSGSNNTSGGTAGVQKPVIQPTAAPVQKPEPAKTPETGEMPGSASSPNPPASTPSVLDNNPSNAGGGANDTSPGAAP